MADQLAYVELGIKGEAVVETDRKGPSATLDRYRGVYNARRAAALSGVPLTTLHRWARQGLYIPSIHAGPLDRLWSWADLLALRAMDWFRKKKGPHGPLPATIAEIRQALDEIAKEGISPAEFSKLVVVSRAGKLFLDKSDVPFHAAPDRQTVMPDVLPLVAPYQNGPSLTEPRPLLRIIPGKLHGEPHLVNTRISTATVYALHKSGYTKSQILEMYPDISPEGLEQALEFEHSLDKRVA